MPTEIAPIRKLLPATTPQQARSAEQKAAAREVARVARSAEEPVSQPAFGSKGETVRAAADQIESYLRRVNTNLEFRVDESAGRVVVSVRERTTGALIRQIPSEEALRVAERLESLGASLLVDQES